jgi:amino acid transporter
MGNTSGRTTRESLGLFRSRPTDQSALTRNLTRFDGIMVLLGNMIGNFCDENFGIIVIFFSGSGIFASPGVTLERAGSPGAALLSWVSAGKFHDLNRGIFNLLQSYISAAVVVFLASCCYVELGCMIPTAGGDFDFLRKAYGDFAAFSYGWFMFWVSFPGSLAINAIVFGNYIVRVFTGMGRETYENSYYSKICALCLAVSFTFINLFGSKDSSLVVNTLTTMKLVVVAVIFIAGLAYLGSHNEPFS